MPADGDDAAARGRRAWVGRALGVARGVEAMTGAVLGRAGWSAAYAAGGLFLCHRMTRIAEPSIELYAVPAFLCAITALVLFALALLTLVRPAGGDRGPS